MKITISSGDIYPEKEMKLITKISDKVYNNSRCLEFVINEKQLEEISKNRDIKVDGKVAYIYYVEYAGRGRYKVYIRTRGEAIKV